MRDPFDANYILIQLHLWIVGIRFEHCWVEFLEYENCTSKHFNNQFIQNYKC